jgi:hypothetical protein
MTDCSDAQIFRCQMFWNGCGVDRQRESADVSMMRECFPRRRHRRFPGEYAALTIRAACGKDDVRAFHDFIGQLQRGDIDTADDALGGARFTAASEPPLLRQSYTFRAGLRAVDDAVLVFREIAF